MSVNDIINVAVVNFQVNTKDKEGNINRIKGFVSAAARRGADLIVFPELCVMGYDFYVNPEVDAKDKIASAETLRGESCEAIAKAARDAGVYVVFGMAERAGENSEILYNSAVVAGPSGVVGAYRKIHLFDSENLCFTKGDEPFMFDSPWGAVSVGICYDTYQFPELMRYYASKGSRLYLNPTAQAEETGKSGSRQAFINYYAPTLEYGVLSNTIFIASANLTGYDGRLYFGGGSSIIGPKITPFYETDVAYYAGDKDNVQEGVYIGTLDLSLAKRRLFVENELTGTPDYRPEIYKKFF